MYRRILVADGSGTSNKALSAALEIASHSGGRSVVRLIHVLDDMAYLKGLDPYAVQSYSVIHTGVDHFCTGWGTTDSHADQPHIRY